MAIPAYPTDAGPQAPVWNHSERLEVESCTVTRWRGYVSSTFVALLDDGTPVAESPAFRSRSAAPPPDAGRARRAFDELRAELQRLGWEDSGGRMNTWYSARFTRLIAVPVDSARADAPQEPPPAQEPPPPQVLEAPPAVEPERRRLREAPLPQPAPPRIEPPVEVEPRPREEPPELPPAAQRALEAARRSRLMVIVASVLGIAAALAVSAYLALGQNGQHGQHALGHHTTPVSVPKPKHEAQVPALAPATTTAGTVRVDISANGRASWLEIRRGSATGRVLFTGELAPGRHLHLTGKRLWARFGAARNLTITANGRPIAFSGTYEHVFVAAKK